MPSTITLQKTIDLTSRYIYQAPLLFKNDGDLAFNMGDWVRQFLLSPPFAWRWNRGVVSPIKCSVGLTDYTVSIPDFGWLEKAWVVFPTVQGETTRVKELSVLNNLAQEQTQNESGFISAVYDDNNGNITFRILPSPDQAYILYINYQKSAKSFTKTTDTWSPIPDYMSYIFTQGFLAKAYEFRDDERFAFLYSQFLKQTVSASDGLTDTQKNIFLESVLLTQRERQAYSQSGQIGRASRVG